VLAEHDGVTFGSRCLRKTLNPWRPDGFAQFSTHNGERSGGSAVVVQLRALVGRPADEPNVDLVVAMQAYVPTLLGISLDGIEPRAYVVGHRIRPLHELGK
jgi:hypothetical protein